MNPKIYMVMVDALRKDYAMTMKSYQLLCDHGVEFAAHRSTNRWTFQLRVSFSYQDVPAGYFQISLMNQVLL